MSHGEQIVQCLSKDLGKLAMGKKHEMSTSYFKVAVDTLNS